MLGKVDLPPALGPPQLSYALASRLADFLRHAFMVGLVDALYLVHPLFTGKDRTNMRIRLAVFVLCLFSVPLAVGQSTPTAMTNSDVISMTKAGIGEQTIILSIQHGPAKFDTSPQALITLKAVGVSDLVLNAILASANSKVQTSPEAQTADTQALFQKALSAIGPHEKIAAIHSYRMKASVIQNTQSGTRSFERETVRVYPGSFYISAKTPTGALQKEVITPEFNYRTSGTTIVAVPPADLEKIRESSEFELTCIAQHSEDYTVTAVKEAQDGNASAERLKVSKFGKDVIWDIDSQTGRLLSVIQHSALGDVVTEYSDWRLVDGVYFPFKRHIKESSSVTDYTVAEYEVNPAIDVEVFQRPAQPPTQTASQGLTLKILQEQSVPYTQESGGGISTSCNIVGTANTSAYVNAYGSSAYGNATTNSNQRMSCNSYDTTIRWPHVLNVMFAQASDGNSYIIACDRAWRWSKCVPLRAGDAFKAHFTEKGIEVEAINTKGKEENPTYHILQSKSWR